MDSFCIPDRTQRFQDHRQAAEAGEAGVVGKHLDDKLFKYLVHKPMRALKVKASRHFHDFDEFALNEAIAEQLTNVWPTNRNRLECQKHRTSYVAHETT